MSEESEKIDRILSSLEAIHERLTAIESVRTVAADAQRSTGSESHDVTLQILRTPIGGKITVNGENVPYTQNNSEGTRAIFRVPADTDAEVVVEGRGFLSKRLTVRGMPGEVKQIDGSLELP